MRTFISGIFAFLLMITVFFTIIVGISWLFDYKPHNLHLVWEVSYKSLAVSFFFHLLFSKNGK